MKERSSGERKEGGARWRQVGGARRGRWTGDVEEWRRRRREESKVSQEMEEGA